MHLSRDRKASEKGDQVFPCMWLGSSRGVAGTFIRDEMSSGGPRSINLLLKQKNCYLVQSPGVGKTLRLWNSEKTFQLKTCKRAEVTATSISFDFQFNPRVFSLRVNIL